MASVKNGIQRVTHKLESLDPRNYQKHNQQYLLWFCIAVMADATSGFQIPAVRDTYTWKGETSDATAYTIVLFPTPLGGFRTRISEMHLIPGQSSVMEGVALAFVLVLVAVVPFISWMLLVSLAIVFTRGLELLLGEQGSGLTD
ncbi:uncharacterized protein LOC135105224 isoform X2 [Scylla paramamosain]|uniref:uncharacterized protein LOC135105224 isoform X2 n=1 Tax=Scylla paramamosain TaxID=85552 RepID=UPI00308387B8